jgi:hypothetical protein
LAIISLVNGFILVTRGSLLFGKESVAGIAPATGALVSIRLCVCLLVSVREQGGDLLGVEARNDYRPQPQANVFALLGGKSPGEPDIPRANVEDFRERPDEHANVRIRVVRTYRVDEVRYRAGDGGLGAGMTVSIPLEWKRPGV